MSNEIRLLSLEDFSFFKAMNTGIKDDYVERIFPNLVSGPNRLFGLFQDGRLASVGGYTIFAKHYAMMGRIRSDIRDRGKNFSTQLTLHLKEQAFQHPGIEWVGANTQEENTPARRVLEKSGLREQATLFGAITQDVSVLEKGHAEWKEIHGLAQKKAWLDGVYVKPNVVFPYECYYLLPASTDLFVDKELEHWSFYENEAGTRVLIAKKDVKGHHYLHAVYPWNDIAEQKGLWETISAAFNKMEKTEEKRFIWMDLTHQQVQSLPENHSFTLPSPWILYSTTTP